MSLSDDAFWVLQDPYRLLALELAVPKRHVNRQNRFEAHLTVDEDHINLSVPNFKETTDAPLLIDKEGFLMCCMLLSVWLERCALIKNESDAYISKSETEFYNDCVGNISKIVQGANLFQDNSSESGAGFNYWKSTNEYLLSNLDISLSQRKETLKKANDALFELESKGFILDPPFAGAEGIVVLLGLIPLKYNNKTSRGENISKEISLHAALWDFTYKSSRGIRGKSYHRSISVNLRGLNFIKNLARDMAKQYLKDDSEKEDSSNPRDMPKGLDRPNEQD